MARTLYYYYFFALKAILYFLFFPALWYTLRSEKRMHHGHALRRFWGRLLYPLTGTRIQRIYFPHAQSPHPISWIQLKRQLNHKPYIICANHRSELDIGAAVMSLPLSMSFMGKEELAHQTFLKIFFQKLDIPVDRENPTKAALSFKAAAKRLKLGFSIVIFPEGGIPDHPQTLLVPFKDGPFAISARFGIPIIPIAFPDNQYLHPEMQKKASPGRLRIGIAPPISPTGHSAQDISTRTFDAISAMLHHEDFYRDR